MNSFRAWIQRVPEARSITSSPWGAFAAALAPDVATCDVEASPELPGLLLIDRFSEELLKQIRATRHHAPIIAIVQHRAELGSRASWQLLQAGVDDVIVVEECPNAAAAVTARLRRYFEVAAILDSPVIKENLVGESAAWLLVIRRVVEVARFSNSALLITGESGTGKELIARLVHTLDGRPDKGRLAVLDCTTVSPELSGSEFFGHERGAFTHAISSREGVFALAGKGTLFLDEVGELPVALQAELLRAVQERTYKRVGSNSWQQADFRLVCATNRDLKTEMESGRFRHDFFYRIAGTHCHLPALRERRSDILPLARHFLREFADAPEIEFDAAVQDFLLTRDYPGNVRELRQLVLRIAGRHTGPGCVTIGAIPDEDRAAAHELSIESWRGVEFERAIRRALASGAGLQEIKDQTVAAVIQIAVNDAAGNIQRAAIKLGVTDRALQMRRAAQRESNGPSRLPRAKASEWIPPAMDRETRPPLPPNPA